jgi:hypothetical protein
MPSHSDDWRSGMTSPWRWRERGRAQKNREFVGILRLAHPVVAIRQSAP